MKGCFRSLPVGRAAISNYSILLRNRVCLFVFKLLCFVVLIRVERSPEVWGRSGIVQPRGLAIGYDVSDCQRTRPSCVPSSSSGRRRSRARRPRLVTILSNFPHPSPRPEANSVSNPNPILVPASKLRPLY